MKQAPMLRRRYWRGKKKQVSMKQVPVANPLQVERAEEATAEEPSTRSSDIAGGEALTACCRYWRGQIWQVPVAMPSLVERANEITQR